MKILADPNIPLLSLFDDLGEVNTAPGREWTHQQVMQAEVLLIRSVTKVNADLLRGAKIKFVGSATSGFDHVDRELLSDSGIPFVYCPGSNAVSVAEYVIAAVLKLIPAEKALDKLTAGIIGFGHVGQVVVQKLRALGITCLINDPPRQHAGLTDEDYLPLEAILTADVITLHTPLETSGEYPTLDLLKAHQINQIPKNSLLINAARGGVINENALIARLENGKTIKTVIDCWEGEPLVNTRLQALVDIATPHIAGYSYDGKLKATRMLYEALHKQLDEGLREPFSPSGQRSLQTPDKITCPDEVTTIFPQQSPSLQSQNHSEFLREIVSQVYDIQSDHVRFMQTLNMSDATRRQAFDQQRKNYPERREFDQFCIKIPAKLIRLEPSICARIAALGFHIS